MVASADGDFLLASLNSHVVEIFGKVEVVLTSAMSNYADHFPGAAIWRAVTHLSAHCIERPER